MVDEAHLDHQVGLETQDRQVSQVTQDGPAHVVINRDEQDHLEGLVHQDLVVFLVQLVPVDQQDHRDLVDRRDNVGQQDLLEIEVGTVIEDHQDLVDQLGNLEISVRQEGEDLQVLFIYGRCVLLSSLTPSHKVFLRHPLCLV